MSEQAIITAVQAIIRSIGDDPEREGLQETPQRVFKAYQELFAGYRVNPESLFKTFDKEMYDEMVVLKDAEFTSWCEHHMLPFSGVAHIAYIPDGQIVGLSKLARLLDCYAKRLQVQERLTDQITYALKTYLKPLGAACVVEASHMCMSCRGVLKQRSSMITSSLLGEFRNPEVRQEFFNLIRR